MKPLFEIPKLLHPKYFLANKCVEDLMAEGISFAPIDALKKLLTVSDFAYQKINILRALLREDDCQALLPRDFYFTALKGLSLESTQHVYLRELRDFRNRHLLRLMLLEYSGFAPTEEIMCSWSDCADALILHALAYCQQVLRVRHGVPRTPEGKEDFLHTLAMGKLGGRELNYSSDVDLIFAFTQSGETDGQEPLSNAHYWSKLIQNFVYLMQQMTVDGFVFRVDLRLRPNGDSGPVVYSLAAMETYYQEQGRDWERYAMVKARVITENLQTPEWFERLIIPFVYRRYVDFSVIESLRSMKALIEREVQLDPRLDDIKRGRGGIREIEFIIQNVQLIRAGRLPQLRKQNALAALAAIKQAKLIPRCEALKKAYVFFRRLENALQSLEDKQTHSLPNEPIKQAQISWAMGAAHWDELLVALHQFQRIVSSSFLSVLAKTDAYEDEKRMLTNQLSSLWQWHVEESMAVNLLTSIGYEQAEHCYHMIYEFRHSNRCKRLPQSARLRLDRFMMLLLTELAHVPKTDEVLVQVIHLLENIVGRSAYLALLTENPQALNELLFWIGKSPFISSLLASQPFLLETLLNQDKDWEPSSKKQLEKELAQLLGNAQDVEAQEDCLRQFKLTKWLMAARAEVYGTASAVRIGEFLTDLAEVIILAVFDLACTQLSLRHPKMNDMKSKFAIIGYGKLGSREMNYTSDLDLVFLHSALPSDEDLITRLTQKIVHMLTVRTRTGVLYAVDTRLRPSGSAGLLVSPIGAFVTYQKNQAWVWEHQSLLKARVVLGGMRIRKTFQALKESILSLPRDLGRLEEEILSMRAKMEQSQDLHSLKYATGGLLDLEFLVQFLALRTGDASLAQCTHTLALIHQLFLLEVLSEAHYLILKKTYERYHHLLHQNTIEPQAVCEQVEEEFLGVCAFYYKAFAYKS
jgi:glutamate-ammonia-ligase adenylyltransferase